MALKKSTLFHLIPCLVWICATTAQGFEFYRTPSVPAASHDDRQKSCLQIEQEINGLAPLTYSYLPGFYADPYNGASLIIGTTIGWPAYGFLGYGYYVGYQDRQRILPAEHRIETLRRLKAENRCFEG
jgi:hypothetical protein